MSYWHRTLVLVEEIATTSLSPADLFSQTMVAWAKSRSTLAVLSTHAQHAL